jgi:hypothetical protein
MSQPPEIEMTTRSLPGRGLEYVRPHEAGLEALCDCATITILQIDPAQLASVPAGETWETAWTCDGCMSVHWLVFTANPEVTP